MPLETSVDDVEAPAGKAAYPRVRARVRWRRTTRPEQGAGERVEQAEQGTEQGAGGRDHEVDRHEQQRGEAERRESGDEADG